MKRTNFKAIPGGETFETREYLFTYNIKNRPLSEDKVKHFMKLFKDGKNYMREQPALIEDDTWDVFDGQHRYEACKRLGEPFFFRWKTRDSTLTFDKVGDIQTNAGWTTYDFIHTFVAQKKQNYIDLQRFINKYNFPVTTSVMLLSLNPAKTKNESAQNSGSMKKSGFYEGTFVISDYQYAAMIAQRIMDFAAAGFKVCTSRSFIVAYVAAMNHPEYDHKQMTDKILKYGSSLLRSQVDALNYLHNLETVYNYKSQNKIRFSFPKKNH